MVLVLVRLLVRRLRLAILSLVSAAGEVAAIWTTIWALNLSTDVVVGGLTAGKDGVRKVGRCGRKDTLVGRCIVSIIIITPAST